MKDRKPTTPELCEQYRKEQVNRLEALEKSINSLKSKLDDYVRRTWFFWVAGGIGFMVLTAMSMFYSELRMIGHDVNITKIDIAVIKNELKIAEIE